MPMMRGGTPAVATPSIRAIGVSPSRAAALSEAMIVAAAPSFTPEAFATAAVDL
jgi:hypothetical protein